jgi:hypothetical protein
VQADTGSGSRAPSQSPGKAHGSPSARQAGRLSDGHLRDGSGNGLPAQGEALLGELKERNCEDFAGKINAAMNQAERLERLEEQMILLMRKKGLRERVWGWVEKLGVIVGVISSVITLVILFLPQVNVNLDKTLNRNDPFATQFAVVNGSSFSIRDVHFRCILNVGPMVRNSSTEPEAPTERVNAGDTLVRGCGVKTENLNLNATLQTVVIYSYPILGTQQVSVHFEARNDAQGVPQWFKTIETTARLSVQ